MTEEKREIRRKKRVLEYAEKIGNNNTACRRFGIARSTFYLWRDRYQELGEAGLARRRPCSHNHPNKTPDEVIEKILHLRRTYYMSPIPSSGIYSATPTSGRPTRPCTAPASAMASTDSRIGLEGGPCTPIDTRSRFLATPSR